MEARATSHPGYARKRAPWRQLAPTRPAIQKKKAILFTTQVVFRIAGAFQTLDLPNAGETMDEISFHWARQIEFVKQLTPHANHPSLISIASSTGSSSNGPVVVTYAAETQP